MEANYYESVGRIYQEIVDLKSEAKQNGLHTGGGIDSDGEFYISVYDSAIDKRFYGTNIVTVANDTLDEIRAEIRTVKAFILGFSKAREIAAEDAKPDVEFGPLEEVKPKTQEAA